MVEKLVEICQKILMKSCNINSLYEKSPSLGLFLCYFIDEFLRMVDRNVFLVRKCPNQEHASDFDNFCNWCLFYQDCCTFAGEFNELRRSSDVLKIARTFILFFGILNYWNTLNKKMLDDLFDFLPIFLSCMSIEKFKNFRLFFHVICIDWEHEENFHFLLEDLFNIEGDLKLSEVEQINLLHKSRQKL